jgi:hypothetical protein
MQTVNFPPGFQANLNPFWSQKMGAKNPCPITRSHFREHAKQQRVKIEGHELMAQVKEFSTGSLGWYANDKMEVEIGGTKVQVQIGLNLTIVCSKELPTA